MFPVKSDADPDSHKSKLCDISWIQKAQIDENYQKVLKTEIRKLLFNLKGLEFFQINIVKGH